MSRAYQRGYEATSVRDRSLLRLVDHELVKFALEGDFVIVTRNVADFRRLLKSSGVQPGIISLQTFGDDFSASKQADIFEAALDEADARGDLINLDVEAIEHDGVVTVSVYDLPPL